MDEEPSAPEPEAAPETEPAAAQEPQEEPEAVEEPSPAEISVEVPVISDEASDIAVEPVAEVKEEEPAGETAESAVDSEQACEYILLPGNAVSLCSMKLVSGSVRVISGLVTAVSGDVEIKGKVLSGEGMVWFGQGTLEPVVVEYKDGMTIRIDKLAVRPNSITSESAGVESMPSLRKLTGMNSGSLLMFTSGSCKTISVSRGLRVRAGCILATDADVHLSGGEDGFLEVTGTGSLLITG